MLNKLNKNSLCTKRNNSLEYLHLRKLKAISKKYKLALRQSSSKFHSQPQNSSHSCSSNSSAANSSASNTRFSSVLFSKNARMLIAESKRIENLDSACNAFVQIEQACKKISEQYLDGTFYLYNDYPLISVSRQTQFSRQIRFNADNKLSKNCLHLSNAAAAKAYSQQKSQQRIFSKENELILKFFS